MMNAHDSLIHLRDIVHIHTGSSLVPRPSQLFSVSYMQKAGGPGDEAIYNAY